ncbi:MAG: hypothetical protein A2Z34_05135 [Planctomycetes bacterium RBG_16_59_8]|nr:MAG: hypothetical protein A2Z34_05135 [Planctomycetes bacterium RBG_16_59_8]
MPRQGERVVKGTDIAAIARETGIERAVVRSVLKEVAGVKVSRTTQDKIFRTARRLGYDFKKLKIGKRMVVVRETMEGLVLHIERHPAWGRDEILHHLRESVSLVNRVQKRAFTEEFDDAP